MGRVLKTNNYELDAQADAAGDDISEMARLYSSGLTAREVGERVGRSDRFVREKLRVAGIDLRPRGGGSHSKSSAQTLSRINLRKEVEALYAEGMTTRQVAERLAISQAVVVKYLHAGGADMRPAHRPTRYPAPGPRPCQSCGTVFTPRFPSAAVRENQGRYCSWDCRIEGTRKYPPAAERACTRCGKTFRPSAWQVLHRPGAGTYCSAACRKGGQLVACAHCGKEKYQHPSRLSRRSNPARFCSLECWGLYRWKHAEALEQLVAGMLRDQLLRGRRKQVWLGRWRGAEAGHKGGRPRGYTDDQQRRASGLRKNGMSIRAIARITGLSKRQVEYLVTSVKVSQNPF
jgi:DNA-binding CsgD family transcriptional regulator